MMALGFGGLFAAVQHPVADKRSLIEETAEKAAAGQLGGDLLIPSPFAYHLPLAGSREDKKPQRRIEVADFEIQKLTAQAAFIMDKETQTPLFALQANEPRPIGSLTKLMTALVFLETHPDWEKVMTLEEGDGRQGRLYLTEGESATIKDLFHTALISSSNNATMVLVRSTGISPEEFVIKMNEKAQQLGLRQTFFSEPTGLDPANRSTAKEVAWLLKTALAEKSIQEAVIKKSYSFQLAGQGEWRKVKSTNLLLSSNFSSEEIAKINGGKTGFVDEAGYCFAIEAEDKDGHQIIAVVLGSNTHFSRFSEARAAAEWAFRAYEWPE